jgi:hypothetical protein
MAFACRAPTRIVVRVTTDVQCGIESPAPVITLGAVGVPSDDVAIATLKVPCKSVPDQGTVVVTPPPSADRDTPVTLRLAMRYRSDLPPASDECTRASSALCIVQRRLLRFEPYGTIELPIELNANCRGVYCGPLSTCNRAGQCVSADVTGCAGDGCDPTGRAPDGSPLPPGPPVPGADAGADAPSDVVSVTDGAASDADAQAPSDSGEAGLDGGDSGSDAGPGLPTVAGLCGKCTPLQKCCLRKGPIDAMCVPTQDTCASHAPHDIEVYCRRYEDCSNLDQYCGYYPAQKQFNCAFNTQRVACDDGFECRTPAGNIVLDCATSTDGFSLCAPPP